MLNRRMNGWAAICRHMLRVYRLWKLKRHIKTRLLWHKRIGTFDQYRVFYTEPPFHIMDIQYNFLIGYTIQKTKGDTVGTSTNSVYYKYFLPHETHIVGCIRHRTPDKLMYSKDTSIVEHQQLIDDVEETLTNPRWND